MKKNRQILFVFVALMAFASCEKVIDFDPGEVTPYMVLVSQPESDSLVNVYLSKSSFFLESYSGYTEITDATVKLYVGGSTFTGSYVQAIPDEYSYYPKRGYYQFGVRPQPGDSLRIEATVPGVDGVVSASTRIPEKPDVKLIDYTLERDEYTESTTYKLCFKIKSKSEKEYYSISLGYCYPVYYDESDSLYWDTVNMMESSLYFYTDDAIFNNTDIGTVFEGDDGSFSGLELNTSNEMFQNGEHVFTLEFTEYSYGYETEYLAEMPVWLYVKSLSPELYRYNQTVNAQGNADELLSEPVQVMCNINGGIGVFGGMTRIRMRLPVAEIR